jgi:WhiB family transcriptional regulator, redox-sensing transcriptional regulator
MDWRHRSACRGMDPELFQPVGNMGPALVQAVRAKLVCAGCPVIAQCQAWAVERGEPSGVWGGLSEQDRRAARALASGAPQPECALEPAPPVQTCGAGHEVNAENTRIDGRGRLDCRVCGRERQRLYRERERTAGRVAA